MGRLLDEDIVIDALIGISGSKSIEELTEECEVYQSDNRCYSGGVYGAIRAIKALPTIQPERAKGEWINTNPEYKNGFYNNSYYCSECHDYYTTSPYEMKFCPNCGAEMKIRQNG